MNHAGFTHLDESGAAHMVDVGNKDATRRRAVARSVVAMEATTAAAIADGVLEKGDVLAVARIAGIQAAKRTADIIPLCHPLLLSKVAVDLTVEESSVVIEAVVETTGPTGVEMEALHACTAAALTIYDMCKALDRAMVISDVMLIEKSGGRSGDFLRSE
ncbi:MAG: cyclic pyranopterin monophosphate synthase MoaC [Actinomycetota bacterium]|nr:cyclic pyranopterin monophosphate synthase MoaC [Actinomycetota bacterium]MEC8017694.1 cyclic pyranopterin monophosphate synthase MoaC [Actinomycetota bacterium]MEC8465408.1 cyclic pyranopterin monophosphate synthase MoaC [Actinomycetota bacterium]MEC8501955.1 cyclic pyranopterin monophosphate synthase MoaC [Actinomycetota bacterium]MEC8521216.1 cyclic pyranopterin monophosphate synthase MoaC [Actinomycetota bacterium]